jgi:hypothetical protein
MEYTQKMLHEFCFPKCDRQWRRHDRRSGRRSGESPARFSSMIAFSRQSGPAVHCVLPVTGDKPSQNGDNPSPSYLRICLILSRWGIRL